MATSAAVQGAGLLTAVWKKIEKAVYAAGGTDEHIARLDKSEAIAVIERFAADLVATIHVAIDSLFREIISDGKYDYLYGFAEKPGEIEGQTFHTVTRETILEHPAVILTTTEVYEKCGDKMADLSELLDYGKKNPETQRKFPIAIVWKVGDQSWFAILDGNELYRELVISRDRPDFQWSVRYRFLVRK
ncbi:MAG: hypothetical protein ABI643_01935 [Candidatus Doudnabacteria bacterium]